MSIHERGGRRSGPRAHSNDEQDAVIKVAGNYAGAEDDLRDDEIAELDCGDSSGSEPVENDDDKN